MPSAAPCNPVILVPGIKGSELTDEYPTTRDAVWSVLASVQGDYKRLALHPDDRRYERIEPARIAPGPLFNLIYEQFLTSLRHELSPGRTRPPSEEPAREEPVFEATPAGRSISSFFL